MGDRVATVAFHSVEAVGVGVEAPFTGGKVRFILVGLGDKAVTESLCPRSRPPAEGTAEASARAGAARTWQAERAAAEGRRDRGAQRPLKGSDAARKIQVAEVLIYRGVAPGSAMTASFAAGRRRSRHWL